MSSWTPSLLWSRVCVCCWCKTFALLSSRLWVVILVHIIMILYLLAADPGTPGTRLGGFVCTDKVLEFIKADLEKPDA